MGGVGKDARTLVLEGLGGRGKDLSGSRVSSFSSAREESWGTPSGRRSVSWTST